MFPICIGHAHTFEATINRTLTAIDATVHVVFEDEAFGGAVERDKFDGFGRAIFYTETATRAGGRIIIQTATEALWSRRLFERIELCAVFFEQRCDDIFEHGSYFHAIHPFSRIMTRS